MIDHDSVKIYIKDSITQNKISSRQLSYNIKYPTKIITNTIVKFPKPKNQYYIGLGAGFNQSGLNYEGVEFMLKSKNEKLYGLGLGITNKPLLPQINAKMLWKL